MPNEPQIVVAPPAALDLAIGVELLDGALARDPENLRLLGNLATRLVQLDRFEEVIALLAPRLEQLDFGLCLLLAKASFFKRGTDLVKAGLALRAAERALHLAESDRQRARALADRGKALRELGEKAKGAADLEQSVSVDPGGAIGFKRYAILLLRSREYAALERLTSGLVEQGHGRTSVLSYRVLALTGLGQGEAARELAGFDRFGLVDQLPPPPGWADLAAFNAQVASEILANPGLRFDRYGTASQHSWRVDAPLGAKTPAIAALVRAIVANAGQTIAALPQAEHPWLAVRPDKLELKCWSVITGAEGFERWHLHPEGWMSGGYYVQVPEAVTSGSDNKGCFAFGLPVEDVGKAEAAAFGEKLVRPRSGMLSLFPSHAQHSTFPHGCEDKRICLAFDLCPA